MPTPRYRATTIPDVSLNCTTSMTVAKQPSKTYYNPPATIISASSSTFNKRMPGSRRSIYDWVTPNFHKHMKAGRIINNPLNVDQTEESNPTVDIDYTRVTNYTMMDVTNNNKIGIFPYITDSRYGSVGLQNLTGSASYLHLDNQIDLERLQSLAVTSAWANIKESDILALATAKEASKTVRSLHSLSKQVIRIISTIKKPHRIIKRLSLKQAKTVYNEMEELYMQARYNLRPLYYDMLGVMKLTSDESTIKRARRNNFNRYTTRGRESDSREVSDSIDIVSSLIPYVNLRLHRRTSWEAEARAGVLCQAGEWTKWDQMGLYLIPETIWELVPLSFVLDSFANIGDCISSWIPQPGITTLTSWVVTETVYTQQMSLEILGYSDSAPHSIPIGQLWDTATSCSLLGDLSAYKVNKHLNRIPNPNRSFSPFIKVNLDLPKIVDFAIIGKNLWRAATNAKTTPSPKRRGLVTMDWAASNGRYY